MSMKRYRNSTFRFFGLAALMLLGSACGGSGAPGGPGASSSGGSSAGSTAGDRAGAPSIGGSLGQGGAPSGSAAAPASAGDGSAAAGAAPAGSGGTPSSGPVQTCADPTATGSLDVAPVGSAPGAVTEADLKDGSTTVVHYLMSVPGGLTAGTTDPAKQVGLFITFHEHSGTSKDEINSVNAALTALKRSGDFVVLGMQAPSSEGYTNDDDAKAKQLLAYALKTWPINPRRVYLWGRGAGAALTHRVATAADTKASVAAMITYSWGMERWPSNAANDYPDLYLVIGLDDYPDSHVPLVRRVYQAAKKAMFNVIYREVPGLKGPTGNAVTNTDAVNWAISSRHKTQSLSAAEGALLAPYEDAGAAAGICPDGAQFAKLALVGGAQAGHVMPGVLNAGAEASRVLAARVVGRGNLGNEADAALASKLADPSASVRKEVIASLAQAADWRNQTAQKALIDFATNATADATERGLAVDAIGVAVKYQIGGAVDTGAYQDRPLFQALITLLGDSNVSLRTKAFNILKPALTSSYDPAAEPAAQQAAIQAWQAWFMTLTG